MATLPLDHEPYRTYKDRYCKRCDAVTRHDWLDQRVFMHREESLVCTACGRVKYHGTYVPAPSEPQQPGDSDE